MYSTAQKGSSLKYKDYEYHEHHRRSTNRDLCLVTCSLFTIPPIFGLK